MTLLDTPTPGDEPAGRDYLLGVQQPNPGPEDIVPESFRNRPSEYETITEEVARALTSVQERLRGLRAMREDINAMIRQLVEDEELLTRMTRVRRGQRGPAVPDTT